VTNHVRPARRVHVVEDGSRTAPSMLLIHGTAGSLAWWDPMIPALTQQQHVVRVDLPGHGRSAPVRSYAVVAQAHRVSEVLDELSVDSVTVVGHSSGGCVATALAEQRPDIVPTVALINSGPTPDALAPQARINRLVSAPLLGRLIWTLRSDTSIRKGLNTAFTRPVDIPDSIVNAVRNMTYQAFTTAPRESLAYIAQRALPTRLASLDARLLVIFGTEDRRWRSSSARAYNAVPDARVELLPGIGHTPMYEGAQITSELLLDFAASNHASRAHANRWRHDEPPPCLSQGAAQPERAQGVATGDQPSRNREASVTELHLL
jgi:pimeloyl-ACP methyl ester carboxylesterase